MRKSRPINRWSEQRASGKGYHVVRGEGIPCPKCSRPTQIREHVKITEKHLSQSYYFSRWFYCRNAKCPVTLHAVEDYKMRRESAHDNSIVKSLSLGQISLEQRAQPRASIDQQVVDDYARDLHEGAKFPPVTAFYDGTQHWLADGFHRYQAHAQTGAVTIRTEVREGTLKDAVLFSVSANATHGLRRSPEDKRRAIRTLLEDEEWGCWSENEIAKKCGVSRRLVTAVKKELEAKGHLVQAQDPVTMGF